MKLGQPRRKISAAQRKALNLLAADDRSLLLKRWRQRQAAAAYCAKNPEKSRAQARAWKHQAARNGYYRKGGRGCASHGHSSTNRNEYWRMYNLNVRKPREVRA